MKKFVVSVRKSAPDWEVPADEWTDEYYQEPFIEAETPEEAESTARDFIRDCGYSPEKYDFWVEEYEE